MKKTPLKRFTPLKSSKPIAKISKKKQKENRQEVKVRKELKEACGGVSQLSGRVPDFRGLSCHETIFRSHSGEVTKENSKMITGKEHSLKHGIKEVDSKPMFRWIVLILVVIFSLLPVNTYAWCGCNNGYPPQLDEQQGVRWVNALPTARPYLARLWEVPQQIAEFYGAKYKMLTCGSGFYGSNIQSGFGYSNDSNDRWNLKEEY